MQVRSLAWEDPLEEGRATHSSILAWTVPWAEEPVVHRVRESQTQLKRLSRLTHMANSSASKGFLSQQAFWLSVFYFSSEDLL